MTAQPNNQTQPSQAADSYDAHIIPAETAARKEREGRGYKHVPGDDEPDDRASDLDTADGYTVDTEGLVNNYAVEPEMYIDTPGDLHPRNDGTSASNICTIIDTFPSSSGAEAVLVKMKNAGVGPHQISILGKNYQDTEHVQGDLTWKGIREAGGLATVLTGLGIAKDQAQQHEADIESGKFVIVVTGSESDVAQAYQILHAVGHNVS